MTQNANPHGLRQTLARYAPLKATYHGLRSGAFSALSRYSPEMLARLRFRAARGRWPDLENPATYDEKLLWLNLYWRHPLKTECGDKFTVREYAKRLGLGHLLSRLHGVYDTVDEIEFDGLPRRCVLKCSHGCKCNIFCHDKSQLDVERARRDLRRWLATDYSTHLGELHYAGMRPRVLCEEFLDEGTGELPKDYKMYCFDGRFHCTEVCSARNPNGKAKSDFRDREWTSMPYDEESLSAGRIIPRPARYAEMIAAAERLSAPFPFVRVDFYSIQDRPILGELTFTPSACIDTAMTEHAGRVLGTLIKLPDKLLP